MTLHGDDRGRNNGAGEIGDNDAGDGFDDDGGHGTFDTFVSIMMSKLVDSNVFLRSVVLSVHHFEGTRAASWSPSSSCLCEYVVRHELSMIIDLMRSVRPDALTQENVCVINTLLVLLMFARRRGELESTLAQIRAHELEEHNTRGSCYSSPTAHLGLLLNFRVVLDLWTEYYLVQASTARDPKSLAYSTGVEFCEWVETVAELTGPRSSPVSLEFSG